MDESNSVKMKPLPQAPNYSVSSDGYVYSFAKNPNGVKLKNQVDYEGYAYTKVYAGGKRKIYRIHRLVAELFVPNPHGKDQVNHINGDKLDNRACNLEWVTNSENIKHSYDVLGRCRVKGSKHNRTRKLDPIEVAIIRQTDIPASLLAEYFNITQATVCNARNRRTYKELP